MATTYAQLDAVGIQSAESLVKGFGGIASAAENPAQAMKTLSQQGLQMAANYGVDPFDGMEVIFNDTLYAASAATTGQAIAIVGDLNGVQANFPNGYNPTFKYDDLSLSEKDLVKIVGRLPVGHEVVACGRFTVIKKS